MADPLDRLRTKLAGRYTLERELARAPHSPSGHQFGLEVERVKTSVTALGRHP